jgi:hypothetical protein
MIAEREILEQKLKTKNQNNKCYGSSKLTQLINARNRRRTEEEETERVQFTTWCTV